jgi:putative transposase
LFSRAVPICFPKSFPLETDPHLLIVNRYVERNPLRANLVTRAEDWRWSSLWRRVNHQADGLLCAWPIDIPGDWTDFINEPQSEAELAALRQSVHRSSPFGNESWQSRIAKTLGIESTLRPPGRPRRIEEVSLRDRVTL